MQVSQLLNPINMPVSSTVRMASEAPAPTPEPNPYNSHSDGFFSRTIFGGISGKNMAHLVFERPAASGLDGVLKNAYVRQAGVSMGIGAGLYGGLSVIKQGFGMMRGQQDAQGAAANVLSDVLRGGASGLGASAGGGLTGLAMKAMGATGTIGTIVSFVGGAIGASIGGGLMEATGVRETLIEKFGSEKALAA